MADEQDFYQLNEIANEMFFDGRHQGLPVYLNIDGEQGDEICNRTSLTKKDLEEWIGLVTSSTIKWGTTNIYSFHRMNLERWYRRDFKGPPPYTALLLALSLAAEHMRNDENFSSNNYYQRLGETFLVHDDARVDELRSQGNNTQNFWRALNLWLTRNDFNYGKPTAHPISRLTYVGYAISQSLVRDADRAKMHDLFSRFQLSPSGNIGLEEMKLYMHEWMAGDGPSNWLRKLWGESELRELLATEAMTELETWEGSEHTENSGPLENRLSWLFTRSSFPRFRAEYRLSCRHLNNEDTNNWVLADESSDIAKNAVTEVENIWLEPFIGTELDCLEPAEKLKLDALLLAKIILVNKKSHTRLTRAPLPIIPLAKSESGVFFREVSRASLYTEHAIICHENWVDTVTDYLDKFARPSYRVQKQETCGLPNQWSLIMGVEILLVPQDKVEDRLQCLVPLYEGTRIEFVGGLKLDHGIWHSGAPPEVFASDGDDIYGVKVIADEYPRQRLIYTEEADDYRPDFLSTAAIDLEGVNYILCATKDGKNSSRKSISFRTARTPKRPVSGKGLSLAYPMNRETGVGWGISAMMEEDLPPKTASMQGMLLRAGNNATELTVPISNSLSELLIEHELEEPWREQDLDEVEGSSDSCIIRGYHAFQCPPSTTQSRSMKCKTCGLVVVVKKPRSRRRSTRSVENVRQPFSVQGSSNRAIPVDVVCDALCYLGSGTWSKIESILSPLVEAPWAVSELARDLIDLGLIDVMLNESTRRPQSWSCPPPCLVVTNEGAYLSGFRNEDLINTLRERLVDPDFEHRIEEQPMAPTLHRWIFNNCNESTLKELVGDLHDPYGRPLIVTSCPCDILANMLPTVIEMLARTNPIHVEDKGDIEKFDPRTGRWERSSLIGPGAYRNKFAGRRYFYRDAEGDSYETGFELSKILAARYAGIRLHGYDRENEKFQCVIGCRLPGLYGRALVSASGKLPSKGAGKMVYEDVPRQLASLVMDKLYG